MKNLKYIFLLLFCPITILAQKKLELKELLKDLYDLSALPGYLPGTYSAQESSYDRTGNNNDGFNGDYSFVRRNADSTLVLFDVKGKGVVNRIWTPTPTDDSLDFYIDNDVRTTFTIKYRDLFTGKVYPFVAPLCANQLGGFYCYLPIPFNKSCKIILKGKKTMFHQVGYRLYPADTEVKSFSLPLDAEEKKGLEKIKKLWAGTPPAIDDFYNTALTATRKKLLLNPGQQAIMYETRQAGRIAGFEIVSPAEIGLVAKNIDIRISYDDEAAPAVYCPLADYFGYAFGKASMHGLLVGSDGKKHYSWFPIPFDSSAKIELIYRPEGGGTNTNSVDLSCTVYSTAKKRDPLTEGKFYAHWNNENPVPTGKPYTMLDVQGKGHFVGVALQSQGLVPGITGFFEGDDSTVVDGEMRMHGTGSEDFFNGGWYALLDCWDDAMSLPLSGSLEYSLPLSRTGGYRFFITDKVSFTKSFLQTIEHGPEQNRWPAEYTSVSYFYNDRNIAQRITPNTSNTKIYMPDTLEIYPQLTYSAMDNFVSVEAKWAYPVPAKTVFYTIRENSLVKLSLQEIPAGNYRIYLDYVKGPNAAAFALWQRQTPLTDWIEAYQKNEERLPMQPVAGIQVTRLNNSFSFHFKPQAGRDKFTLSRVILVKEK